MNYKQVGFSLITAAVVTLGGVLYFNRDSEKTPEVQPPQAQLEETIIQVNATPQEVSLDSILEKNGFYRVSEPVLVEDGNITKYYGDRFDEKYPKGNQTAICLNGIGRILDYGEGPDNVKRDYQETIGRQVPRSKVFVEVYKKIANDDNMGLTGKKILKGTFKNPYDEGEKFAKNLPSGTPVTIGELGPCSEENF